jgi:hypothetical protein
MFIRAGRPPLPILRPSVQSQALVFMHGWTERGWSGLARPAIGPVKVSPSTDARF